MFKTVFLLFFLLITIVGCATTSSVNDNSMLKNEELIDIADKAAPENKECEDWINKGIVSLNSHKAKEALSLFNNAVKICPQSYLAWNYKGFALEDTGMLQEAILAFDQALKVNSEFYAALNNKGLILDKLGKPDEAIKAYDKALEINPSFAAAWFNKACVYAIRREKQLMLDSLKKTFEFDPQYKEWYTQVPDFLNYIDDPDFLKLDEM